MREQTNKKREINVTSDMMKIVIASHFRFKLHYYYTCTEYDFMDICCCNGKKLVEIECKISKADLKKDKLKSKHKYYSGEKKTRYKAIPNRFYYAITREMYEDNDCIEFIEQLNQNYGIMIIENWREPIIVKKAKNLHLKDIPEKFIESIIKRITSENIGLRTKLYKQKNDKEK